MPAITDNLAATLNLADDRDGSAMERRLYRLSCWTVGLAVFISAPLSPWRVTTGLLLGGLLSLFNYHWLRGSVMAAFRQTLTAGLRPKFSIARYVLRYFVIAIVLALASALHLISLVAALLGLCSFVVAIMLEGLIQITLAIIHREEY